MRPDKGSLVSRVVLRDQIKEVLLERILNGDYPPGERLVETQIAKEFGTSQAPVREALRDLEALRLVQSQSFRGTTVRALSGDELAEVYPVRAALEETAARLAAPQLRGNVEAMQAELAGMRRAAEAGDVHAEIRHDVAFHRLMVTAADNQVLLDAWLSLRIDARTTITFLAGTVGLQALADRHEPLLNALASGDPDGAAMEARRHIEEIGELVPVMKSS